jgi:hypothetical protein
VVSESGRIINELISDDCKAVLLVEAERAVTRTCPYESGTSFTRTIDSCAEENAANTATLVRLGHGHATQLNCEV